LLSEHRGRLQRQPVEAEERRQVDVTNHDIPTFRNRTVNHVIRDIDDVWDSTRTMKTVWWYRRLAWQMPFHAEHHAWPSIPFHQLPAVHELLLKRTAAVTTTSNIGTVPNNSATASSKGRHADLWNRGEVHAELQNSWQRGYLSFHSHFLKNLLSAAK
jgi:hypothetical protein